MVFDTIFSANFRIVSINTRIVELDNLDQSTLTQPYESEEIMEEMSRFNQIILDSLPHWAMLIEVKTRTVLAANKLAIDGGANINCQCWDDFGHRQFISEEHKQLIAIEPDRKRDNKIMCDFCLADDAMESGQPTRKEVEIDGTIWDTWWVPVEKDIYLHYAMDITEIRKTQAALQESEGRYRRAVNTMQDGLVIASKDGKIQFVNKAFCETYQYSQEELIGMHALKVIHPDYHHVFERFVKEAEENGNFSGGTVDVRKDGSTFHTDVRGSQIDFKGRECLLAVIRDISAAKRMEQERERLIAELQGAISQVRTLSGMLPICSSYKKIRDDKGYWNQIESYIHKHSEAEFSHGICPECAKELYPDLDF